MNVIRCIDEGVRGRGIKSTLVFYIIGLLLVAPLSLWFDVAFEPWVASVVVTVCSVLYLLMGVRISESRLDGAVEPVDLCVPMAAKKTIDCLNLQDGKTTIPSCAVLIRLLESNERVIKALNLTERPPRWKRWFDLFIIIIDAPVWVPLLLFLSVLIKCVSRGPVFIATDRVGLHGKQFKMYRLRTMKVEADIADHKRDQMDELNSHERCQLIPFGGFLRSSGLVELPQFWNVLLGDMSLVGPRPCTPHEAERLVDWQKKRFATRPGLTGLWQVRGKNLTTHNQMILLDIFYIDSLSFPLELKIILLTLSPLSEEIADYLRWRSERLLDEQRLLLGIGAGGALSPGFRPGNAETG